MTISTSQQKYNYYRCTGKKRLHTCDATPIGAEELEKIVVGGIRHVLGKPKQIDHLIRILREEAEQMQAGSVSRLRALLEREKEIKAKLDNAVDAVLNGMNSPTVKKRITELETEKASVDRELRALRASVDASAVSESRLREILAQAIGDITEDRELLLTMVYRVEVAKDTVTIWTLLDADPNGHIDIDSDGVTINPCFPSGVPKKNNPNLISVGEGFGLFLFLGGQHG